MKTSHKLFGTNGIREIAQELLSSDIPYKVSLAVATALQPGPILVGRDGRTSSPAISEQVVAALLESGRVVFEAGMVPTPTLQFLVGHHHAAGGIMVTASHNPPEYNGIKVIYEDGVELPRRVEERVEQLYRRGRFQTDYNNPTARRVKIPDPLYPYESWLQRHIDIDKTRLSVVVDPGNGVSALTVPILLRKLGCRVTTINADIDGRFPGRPSEPSPTTLKHLSEAVQAYDADFGVGLDGDGDRALFADENGRVLWGDESVALMINYLFQYRRCNGLVTPVSSSRILRDMAEEHGKRLVWTPVGSINVSRTMLQQGVDLGAEDNGGLFYSPHIPVRDGTFASLLMTEILSVRKLSLSKLRIELPATNIAKEKVPCNDEAKPRVLEAIHGQTKAKTIDATDGLKIWFSEDSWILIRPSGTEPLVRLYVESPTPSKTKKIVEEYKATITNLIKTYS